MKIGRGACLQCTGIKVRVALQIKKIVFTATILSDEHQLMMMAVNGRKSKQKKLNVIYISFMVNSNLK